MRTIFAFLAFAVLSLAIPPTRAASSTGPGQIDGEQLDERVSRGERLMEASKSLTRYVQEEERVVHFQLIALASRLRRSFGRVSPDELLDLRRRLAPKEKEVKEHLAKVQERRQYLAMRAARFREMSKGLILPPNVDVNRVPPAALRLDEMGKRFQESAQQFEKSARNR
jgi:hypothetical protein